MARPVVPIRQLDRRLPELGRIKDGVKTSTSNGGQRPKAIDTLRITSQDPKALAQVAAALGGEVVAYSDPKSTDTHELLTPVTETPVILPPDPLSGTPMYEMYSGGGRERWCDGITCEQWRKGPDGPEPFDVACPCAAVGELSCKPTVHLSIILPYTRLGGTWRWTTHSYNAAVELPGMVEAIQSLQSKGMTRGVLRVDKRTQTIAGVTRKFVVPVLGVDATADELAAGQATLGALGSGGASLEAGEGSDGPSGSATVALPPPERVTVDAVIPPSVSGGGEPSAPVPPAGVSHPDEGPDASGPDGDAVSAGAVLSSAATNVPGGGAVPPDPFGPVTSADIERALLDAGGKTIPEAKRAVLRAAAVGHGHGGTWDDLVADETTALAVLAELGGTLPEPSAAAPVDLTPWKQVDEDAWSKWNRRCQAKARGTTDRPGVLDEDDEVRAEQRHAMAFQASRKRRGVGNEVTSWADLTEGECSAVEQALDLLRDGGAVLTFGDIGSPGGWVVERSTKEKVA